MSDIVFQSFNDLFVIDEKKAAEGVWKNFGQNRYDQNVMIKIRFYESETCLKEVRDVESELEATRHDDKAKAKVWAGVMARGVIVDWLNVLDSNGDQIKYNQEIGENALKQYDKLLLEVMRESQNRSNFRRDDIESDQDPVEDTEKN